MTNFLARNESLTPGDLVELYTVDLNPLGYNVYLRYSPSAQLGTSIWFGGNEYLPRPINCTGFKRSGNDAPPEPVLSISNIDKGGNALCAQYNDLLGAKVTRLQTYKEFLDRLDDGVTTNPTADSAATHLPEIWYIEQKETQNHQIISWRLKSILDLGGKKFPNRLVLKDVCLRVYRYWDSVSGTFKYSQINACPYAGSAYFLRDGSSITNPALDECTKDYKGCNLRYPSQDLPLWAFPGVSKLPRQ